MKILHEFLVQIRPIINARGLEKVARIPKNTLGKHYRWVDQKPDGRPINPDHAPGIVRAICAMFGTIDLDGWRITCDPEGPAIFAIRPISGREAETVELTEGNFEYLQPEWRHVYDDFDFVHYFLTD